jgi:HAD superfamily hydrolase (TIGR01459 family)
LNQIAENYSALLCDIWGVVHNGEVPFLDAVEALKRFREIHGPVILITNAPVPAEQVEATLARVGVEPECYDGIVSSGDAAKYELERRTPGPLYRIGPEYDDPLYHDLATEFTYQIDEAACISCTGLRHLPNDKPENYVDELQKLADKGLDMICANPDKVFRYGDELIPAAGSLAELYEHFGGRVIRPGKPGSSIYQLAYDRLEETFGYKLPTSEILAIGDGPSTDALGAYREGLDFLFVGNGIHGQELAHEEDFVVSVQQLVANEGADVAYATPTLVW